MFILSTLIMIYGTIISSKLGKEMDGNYTDDIPENTSEEEIKFLTQKGYNEGYLSGFLIFLILSSAFM